MARVRFDIRQAQRPLMLALIVLLVLNLGAYAGLVRPKIKEFEERSAASSPQIQVLRERQKEVEGLESFVAALQQADTDLRTLREDVLSTRNRRMVEVQEEVAELCDRFNIDLELVTYEHDVLATEGLEVLRMTVPLEAGYAALRRFLQAVESSEKFLVVERVTLGQGKEGGVVLLLNITLATYFDLPGEAQMLARRERR